MKQVSSVRSDNRAIVAISLALALVMVVALVIPAIAAAPYPPMMTGRNGYTVSASFTIGESVGSYTPVGIPDGTAAFDLNAGTVRVLVNHELDYDQGYAYTLANGTALTGGRVSYFDFDKARAKL